MTGPFRATAPLPKQAILLVNAKSRSGADEFAGVRDKLVAAGIDLIDAQAITDPADMGAAVAGAVTRAPMVILGGGDGSLSANIGQFVGRDTVFALVPLGTANSFAGTLGIPRDIDSAVAVIAHGQRRRIDVGRIDARYFANAAAIGLSPMIARTVPHQLKRVAGVGGYLVWAMWCALRFRPFRLRIDQPGRAPQHLWATEVRIANGSHHGGVELVESQTIDSGDIVVQAVAGKSIWRLGWSWFATVVKLRARHGTLREFRGDSIGITTRPRQKISIDGEVGARTPVRVSVLPAAVEIAVPRAGQFAAK
jgi:diacylglycerol kinase family enzyme